MTHRPIPVLIMSREAEARGPLAAALLSVIGHQRYKPVMAALNPCPVHRLVRRIMVEQGLEFHEEEIRSLSSLLGRESFSLGIAIVGKNERTAPRLFPGVVHLERWDIDAPHDDNLETFQELYDQMSLRINEWVVKHAGDRELIMVAH